jgi:imidazolonepropionase-like amidohydrolase
MGRAPLAAFAALAPLVLLTTRDLRAQAPASLSANVRPYVTVDAPVVALTHVRVIDGTGAAPAADQTVVIENGRITSVGPAAAARVPAGARVLDLTGSTVIPGMMGLHDHSYYTTSSRSIQQNFSSPRLYLASGVTTIRTTGSNYPYAEINLKKQIDSGLVPGPRMFVTGPYLTGENASVGMVNLKSAEDARRVVAYWAEEGATWFKFYTGVTREEAKAAIDEAHKRGLKVTGHICSLGFREAVELGIDNIEHGMMTNSEWSPDKKPDGCPNSGKLYETLDLKSEPVQATIREMVARKIPMTSTLVVFELFVPNRPPIDQRVLDAMSPETRTEYLTSRARISGDPSSGISPEVFRKAMQFERDFVAAGGILAAGVDPTGNGGALAGFGDQRNYELFIEAGFTPAQAVQILTLNGAKVLGIDNELGSVTVGKKADLIVIAGDPGANAADIRKVSIVFKDGIGYDSPKLIESVRGQVGIR